MGIQEWLSSDQDYETGRLLYEEHGSNSVLKFLFKQGETVYNQNRLVRELEELCPEPETPLPVAIAPEPEAPAIAASLAAIAATEQVLVKLRPLISERAMYHAQLSVCTKQDERKELAFRILDLADKITPLWGLYDYAKVHGHLPAPKPEQPITRDKVQLYKSLTNLRAQRSKLKKKPERLLDLQQVEQNIKRVEEALQHGQ